MAPCSYVDLRRLRFDIKVSYVSWWHRLPLYICKDWFLKSCSMVIGEAAYPRCAMHIFFFQKMSMAPGSAAYPRGAMGSIFSFKKSSNGFWYCRFQTWIYQDYFFLFKKGRDPWPTYPNGTLEILSFYKQYSKVAGGADALRGTIETILKSITLFWWSRLPTWRYEEFVTYPPAPGVPVTQALLRIIFSYLYKIIIGSASSHSSTWTYE